MIAIAHHNVEISNATVLVAIEYTNYLVVKVHFVFRRVLVVLDTLYVTWPDMCGESCFEFELSTLSLNLLQLTLSLFEKGSNLLSDFLRFELVAHNLFC